MKITITEIARICHEANRAYCIASGDDSQVEWDSAPQWARDSAREGVKSLIAEPTLRPYELHQNWLEIKLRAGWTYGPVKDPEKKTHPCILPWVKLPKGQRKKDDLFRAIVRSFVFDREIEIIDPPQLPEAA